MSNSPTVAPGNAETVHTTVSHPAKRGGWRSVVRGLKRLAIGLVLGLIVLVLVGMGYQAVAADLDKRNFLPPGQMIAVDGHQMHIHCTGQGSPTIILDAGAYSFSTEWYWVQDQLEKTYRVCSYDRAGNGWSEAVPGPRDGLTLVHELHSLLQQAKVAGPYALVGHSLGGVLSPIYASAYPDDVLGIVQVDPAVPLQWPDKSAYEQYKSQNESSYLIIASLTRVGLIRFILSREFAGYGYPATATAQLTAFKSTSQAVDTWDAEVRLAQWDLGQQLRAAKLGSRPDIVLWASHPEITAPEDRQRLEAIWGMLPVTSSNTVTRIVEGANHGSIVGQPDFAAQIDKAVLDVIDSASTGLPLSK